MLAIKIRIPLYNPRFFQLWNFSILEFFNFGIFQFWNNSKVISTGFKKLSSTLLISEKDKNVNSVKTLVKKKK